MSTEQNDPKTGKWLTPHAISFVGGPVVPDEILVIYKWPGSGDLDVTLTRDRGTTYRVHSGDTNYEAVAALYRERAFIWIIESEGEIIFRGNHNHTLAGLYEELTREHYRFFQPNMYEIRVYRNQGEALSALDRELWLDELIANYQTSGGDAEGDTR